MTDEQQHYKRGQHPNSRNNLHPFQPGNDGGVGSRRKRQSLVEAINEELAKPVDENYPTGQTQRQAIAARVVQIALKGKDVDSLAATKYVTSYTDGQPQQFFELDFKRAAIREGEKHGMDPQALIDEASRMVRDAEDEALREQALSEGGAFDDDD